MAKALARDTKEYRNWNNTKVNHIRTTHVPRATQNVYEEYLTKLYIYIYIEMLFRKIYILLDML